MDTSGGWSDRNLVMKKVFNGSSLNRYGFVVSRKVGGAVVRNMVRRRLKEIIRGQNLMPGYDIVFIARQTSARATYAQLEKSSRGLAKRAGLVGNI
ncbi:ribonuclease P protein component [Dehalogenimonas lykanthroporepellens BL-DC-9]|jgi:ribonuclease P protein component|nr:ribonuclease P protein component [Dehalogenimonas lykanthroporepellens BL-DC-9]